MKLKTLLVSAVALLCTAASWAETWTSSTVGAGTFFLYNVGADSYLCSGNAWGSHASVNVHPVMEVTLSTSGTGYSISTNSIYGSKYLGSNGYMDNASATAWTFEAVAGQTNTYKLKNGSNYLYWEGGTSTNVALGSDPGDNKAYWMLVTKENLAKNLSNATSESPMDATFYITNSWFAVGNGSGITNSDHKNKLPKGWSGTNTTDCWGVHSDTEANYYAVEQYGKTFDNYQELTVRPGKYQLKAKGFWRGTYASYIYAQVGDVVVKQNLKEKGDIGGDNIANAARAMGNDDYLIDNCPTIMTGGSLRIGVKNDNHVGSDWSVFDDFQLQYLGNAVSYYSPRTFTNNTSATDETWYAFNIEYAGTYKVESSNTATIYYTQDDSDDAANTENAAIAATKSTTIGLTKGTLYFKSSATSTINITPLVLDGTYYLYNQRFDRFYSRGSWWGTRAVADIYGTPVILTTNATNSTTIKSVDNNGYIKETAWLYTDGNSGDATDFKILVSTVEGYEGYQFANNKLGGTNYLYVNATDLGNGSYGVAGNSIINDNISDWNQTVWQLMSISDHNTKVDAYPITNKTSVIEASGISTTAGDFETYLSSNYVSLDKSALISAISSNNAIGSGWTWNTTRNGNARTNDGYPSYNPSPYASLWKNTGYYTYTVSNSNLPAGIYKLEMQGFDRRQNRNSEATLYETYGNIGSSYLEANGQKVRIMNAEEMFAAHKAADPSWTIDREWAGQLSSLNGNYAPNTVYVYLDGNTDLNLTIEKPDYTDDACLVIGSISMTYYNLNTKMILENKGDITSLINSNFDTNDDGWSGGVRISNTRTWHGNTNNGYYEVNTNTGGGITDGAGTMTYTLPKMPAGTYKVVAAARSYAGGKIQPEIAGSKGATLTGVGDTQVAASEINTNGVQMPYRNPGGFTTDDNGHNWQWITATGTSDSADDLVISFVADASAGDGFKWLAIDDVHVYCTELDGTSYTYTVDDDHLDAGDKVVTADIILSNPNAVITSDAAINGAAGTQINNNLVSGTIANMVLYDGHDFTPPVGEYAATAAKLYRTITADKWSTLMLPFVPTTTFTAKMLPSKLDGEGVLFFEDATPANDSPILVKNESTLTEIIGARESAATGSKTAGADVPMQGVYARQGVPVSTGSHFYYIVGADDNELHKVTGDAVMISAFRAYFDLDDASYVKGNTIIMNFGDETCIKSMDKEQLTNDNAAIYNLAGQRISKPTKGINIINGKKVLVK